MQVKPPIVSVHSHNNTGRLYTAKTLGLLQTSILGHLSCIRVTKECYQIGFLEGSWEAFSISYTSSFLFFFFRRPIWLHSWQYYHNHATKELLQGQMCKIKETSNITTNGDLFTFWKEIYVLVNKTGNPFNCTLVQIANIPWTLRVTHNATEATKMWLK